MVKIVLGVDVEEWFQTMAFQVDPTSLEAKSLSKLTFLGLEWLLELLKNTDSRATFFVNGVLAEAEPEIVPMISNYGYEIACHAFSHRSFENFSINEFRVDLQKAKKVLLGQNAKPLWGYRAPNWSAPIEKDWYFSLLQNEGFKYDASIFPMKTPWFGKREKYPFLPRIHTEGTISVYSAIWKLGPFQLPLGLGFLLRLYPYFVLKSLIMSVGRKADAVQMNIHSWELNTEKISFRKKSLISKFLIELKRSSAKEKIVNLCNDFQVLSISDWLSSKNLI